MTATMVGAPAPEPAPGVRQGAALHAVPDRSVVMKEQIEAVSIAIRNEQLAFLGTLAVIVLLGIYTALRGKLGHGQGNLEYGPQATIPVTLVALLIPFGVWRASDRERRAYDWAMPVAQSTHTVIKMLAGWVWLMIGVAVYLAVLVGAEFLMAALTGASLTVDVPAWEWLVPFTSVTIAYLLTSIPVIGSEHPWRWIGWTVIGYLVALLVLDVLKLPDVKVALQRIVEGYYGLAAAIFGNVQAMLPTAGEVGRIGNLNLASRWLGATAVWGVLAIVGVWLAARRHSAR